MSRSKQLLCLFYALVAVAALYGTWSENLSYPPNAVATQFLTDLRANPASRSISIDIGLFLLAAAWACGWGGLAALARGARGDVWPWITAAALFGSFGLANHHATAALAFPVLLLMLGVARPALLRASRLWITTFLCIGFAQRCGRFALLGDVRIRAEPEDDAAQVVAHRQHFLVAP